MSFLLELEKILGLAETTTEAVAAAAPATIETSQALVSNVTGANTPTVAAASESTGSTTGGVAATIEAILEKVKSGETEVQEAGTAILAAVNIGTSLAALASTGTPAPAPAPAPAATANAASS